MMPYRDRTYNPQCGSQYKVYLIFHSLSFHSIVNKSGTVILYITVTVGHLPHLTRAAQTERLASHITYHAEMKKYIQVDNEGRGSHANTQFISVRRSVDRFHS